MEIMFFRILGRVSYFLVELDNFFSKHFLIYHCILAMFHDEFFMVNKTGLREEIRNRDFRLKIGINTIKLFMMKNYFNVNFNV